MRNVPRDLCARVANEKQSNSVRRGPSVRSEVLWPGCVHQAPSATWMEWRSASCAPRDITVLPGVLHQRRAQQASSAHFRHPQRPRTRVHPAPIVMRRCWLLPPSVWRVHLANSVPAQHQQIGRRATVARDTTALAGLRLRRPRTAPQGICVAAALSAWAARGFQTRLTIRLDIRVRLACTAHVARVLPCDARKAPTTRLRSRQRAWRVQQVATATQTPRHPCRVRCDPTARKPRRSPCFVRRAHMATRLRSRRLSSVRLVGRASSALVAHSRRRARPGTTASSITPHPTLHSTRPPLSTLAGRVLLATIVPKVWSTRCRVLPRPRGSPPSRRSSMTVGRALQA
jgi:hypothetical protein